MKYSEEDYLGCEYYGTSDDEGIENYKHKIVKCRKEHECMSGEESCAKTIKAGEYAMRETGFMDGQPMSAYTCIPCMDKWIDELHGSMEEDEDEEGGSHE